MPLPPYPLTSPAVLAFVLIPLTLVATLAWATAVAWRRAGATPSAARRTASLVALAAAIWMMATWTAAQRGWLLDFDATPPPFALLVLGILVLAFAIAFSRLGARLAAHLPLWALVAVQAFRWPLEIAMHRMAERGIMPDQMSYTGRNFDIVTGVSAAVVAATVWAGRGGPRLVLIWNVIGLALLLNVMTVGILSTPRFAWFGPDRLNVWIMHPPFVWLPSVMVLAALAGHLVVFRAVADRRRRVAG